jgi:WG containing repeat
VTPAYDQVGAFSEGLARVRDGERWGYIDTQGRPLKTPAINAAADFHDGLARVGIELEAAKRLVAGVPVDAKDVPDFMPNWPVMLGEGSPMRGGIAVVRLVRGHTYANDWFAVMNAKGELIVPAPPR